MKTLPCFNPAQYVVAHQLLASRVATMMGRKFEEGDWSGAYCAAKGIPSGAWSNLQIDVMHGNLGVEHKMLCVRSDQGIRSACGLPHMHPAGTRAIRIPRETDATKAARDVLGQYALMIQRRAEFLRVLNRYHHGALSRDAAAAALMQVYPIAKVQAAYRLLPEQPKAIEKKFTDAEPDMRTGWLLWQEALREFLYFEERTQPPNPADYYAEWNDSGGGRRRTSRNLWVFEKKTKRKKFSITTDAGAKIQPYFTVPAPDDPNLYYFVVQGEVLGSGMVRIWLTEITAAYLRKVLGELSSEALSERIIQQAGTAVREEGTVAKAFADAAVPFTISVAAYNALKEAFLGVSDEHMMQLFLKSLKEKP